jgi:hypothetical protein
VKRYTATFDWSGVLEADRPADGLRSITALLETPAYIVSEANDLLRDGALEGIVYTAGMGGMWRVDWTATDTYTVTRVADTADPASGVAGKLATATPAWYAIDEEIAGQIGYGRLGIPVSPAELLLLTSTGVWHYRYGRWTNRIAGLPSGWTWREITTHPFAPDTWLIRGDDGSIDTGLVTSDGQSILWQTIDAGVTWAAVTLTSPGTYLTGEMQEMRHFRRLTGYTTTGQLFMLGAGYDTGSGVTRRGDMFLWRGAAAGMTPTRVIDNRNNLAPYSAVPGISGDVAISINASSFSGGRGYVSSGATDWTRAQAHLGTLIYLPSIYRLAAGTEAVAWGAENEVGGADTYRSSDTTITGEGGETMIGANGYLYDAATIAGAPIQRRPILTDTGGDAWVTLTTHPGTPVSFAADMQTYTVIALLTDDAGALTIQSCPDPSAPTAWVTTAGPAGGGTVVAGLAALAVITRPSR